MDIHGQLTFVSLQRDVHAVVSMIASGELERKKEEVVMTLRNLADELDKKQRDMNIAKTAFASTGIIGTGLVIGGAVAAPFTLGASLGLTAAGVAVGVTSGLGGLATAIADQVVNNKTMKDAEEAIARYMELANELMETISYLHISSTDGDDLDTDDLITEELALVPNMKDRRKLEIILRGVKTGLDAGGSAAHVGAVVGAMTVGTAAVASRSAVYVMDTSLHAVRIGGVVLSVLTIPLDIHVIVTNSIKLHNKLPSVVAEQIRAMARTLQLHQVLENENDCVF